MKETHPSYGIIQINRISGQTKLFGSALPHHDRYFSLGISQAELRNESGQDIISGPFRGKLIEVWLSASQFTELITTMNIGTGVPCTIRRVGKETVEELPVRLKTEAEKAHDVFKKKSAAFVSTLKEKIHSSREMLLSKKPMKVGDRRNVASILSWLSMEVAQNQPFAIDLFKESAEKVVSQAKAEVDALVNHVITSKGMEALGIESNKMLENEKPSR